MPAVLNSFTYLAVPGVHPMQLIRLIVPLTALAAFPILAEENSTGSAPQRAVPAHVTLSPQTVAEHHLPMNIRLPGLFSPTQPAPRSSLVRDKFQRYVESTYSPGGQLKSAITSAFGQAIGNSGEWGTGAGAYANRISSQMARRALANTIWFGFEAAFDVDSQYRRSQSKGFGSRLRHALLSIVTTNKDGGGRAFGTPQIASAYGSAFAANLWYPNSRNSTSDALMRGTSTLAFTAGRFVVKEFWPDIKARLRRR